MKLVHYFIIGGLMLLFLWLTGIVEGKKNKPSGKSGEKQVFKKAFNKTKNLGKKAFEAAKKVGKKVINQAKKKVINKVKKKFKQNNRHCKKDWKKCNKRAGGDSQERNECHMEYNLCTV